LFGVCVKRKKRGISTGEKAKEVKERRGERRGVERRGWRKRCGGERGWRSYRVRAREGGRDAGSGEGGWRRDNLAIFALDQPFIIVESSIARSLRGG
jgi:hypothetical protein